MACNHTLIIFPLVETPDADTLLEGRPGGWDGIYLHAVVAQNKNMYSFKNGWIPQSLSYIYIFLHCLPLKWLPIVLLKSTSRATKEADITPLTYGYILRYLGLWILMSTCYGWKREGFGVFTPFDQEANPCPYCLRKFMSKSCFDFITHKLSFTKNNSPPYVDKLWKIHQMVMAWNDHMTSIFLSS